VYLLAQVDLYEDQFMDKEESTAVDKAVLRGQRQIANDILGLPNLLNTYKLMEENNPLNKSKKEIE